MIAFTFAVFKKQKVVVILVYNFFIAIARFAIGVAALWNPKAKEWVGGRKNWYTDLKQKIANTDSIIWMHCASAGEFEQGKPIIIALKKNYPHNKILVSFFSPSGYNAAKKNKDPDYITYLPLDTKINAQKFVKLVRPQLVIFIKYDFWYYFLNSVATQKIPMMLVSSVFREQQAFFQWYGGMYRKMAGYFSWIFVQDDNSKKLLNSIGVNNCSVNGDTRFDRVIEIAENFVDVPYIKDFIKDDLVLVAGSTWQQDEECIATALANEKLKLIIAQHKNNK